MDEIMGAKKESTKEEKIIEAKVKALMAKQNRDKDILELDPSAGDKQINSDAIAMYEFSNGLAK